MTSTLINWKSALKCCQCGTALAGKVAIEHNLEVFCGADCMAVDPALTRAAQLGRPMLELTKPAPDRPAGPFTVVQGSLFD